MVVFAGAKGELHVRFDNKRRSTLLLHSLLGMTSGCRLEFPFMLTSPNLITYSGAAETHLHRQSALFLPEAHSRDFHSLIRVHLADCNRRQRVNVFEENDQAEFSRPSASDMDWHLLCYSGSEPSGRRPAESEITIRP